MLRGLSRVPSVQIWNSTTIRASATSMPYCRMLPRRARTSSGTAPSVRGGAAVALAGGLVISVWAMPYTCSFSVAALTVMRRMSDSWVASARPSSPVSRPSAIV